MKNFTKFLSTLSLLLFISINTFSQVSGDVSVGLQVYNKADAGTTLSGSNVTCWNEQSDQGFNARRASYKEPEISNVAENSGNSKEIEGIGGGQEELLSTFNGGSAPTITAISANICAGGSITITGYNFGLGILPSSVTIGSTTVSSITSFSDTKIIAVVNSACSGYVTVTNLLGTGTSTGMFTSYAIPTAPVVATPINYCQNAVASQLTATGSNLTWGSGPISGTAGGTTVLSGLTYISNLGSNKETDFTTTASNVEISSVDYYVPANQSISGVSLALYNSSGTVIATSSTVTTLHSGGSSTIITNIFNYTIASAGNYSIGIATGTGTIGGDSTISFPITEATGTINVTGTTSPVGAIAPYHCFNNIQFSVNNGATAPIPSTSVAGTTNYLVSQTVSGCVSPQATIAVIVNNPPSATISYSGTPFCKSLGTAQAVTQSGTSGGSYSVSPSGLSISSSNGAITPSTSTAGTYTVTYTMAASGGCSAQTATTSVTITSIPSATISYSGTPFCKSLGTAQAVTQSGTSGGTYSASPSGLSISSSNGAITPSTSTTGTYTVTYTMAASGGCSAQTATTSVTITSIPSATISYSGTPFCQSVGTAQAVTQSGTSGGTYSASPSGLSISSSNGAITPSTSTTGTYTVTYTMAASGGCSSQTATTSVTITSIPSATISYSGTPFCQSVGTAQAVTQSGTSGGTYSASPSGLSISSSNGAITPSSSTAGTYTVTYTIAASGGCSVYTTTTNLTVNALSVGGSVGSNATVCSVTNSGTLSLTGQTGSVLYWQYSTDAGSTWANISNTTTSLSYSNLTQTTQYRAVVQSGVCATANSSAATITVNAVSVGGSVGSNATVCSGTNSGTVYLTGQTGNVVNWQYSTDGGTTWTVIVNTTTSQTYSNLTQTTIGRAVVQNGVCPSANSSIATITVTPLPSATISYTSSPYCSDGGSASVTTTGTSGGTYSSTTGLSINSSSGIINLNASTPGTYTVIYTVAASGGCSLYSTTTNVTITNPGSWIGAVNTDWNNSGNWLCGQIPTSAFNVTIPAGASYYPVISSGIDTANNITIESGGSLTVAGGDLQIFGAITNNSGTFDATAGTIEMKGAAAQTIDGSTFYKNTIDNLIVSNSGSGLSVSSTASDTLKITGTLTFGNSGSTLNTGDNITLVSNNTGTASVGIVGSGNTISGNVTVERYINVGTAAGQHAKSWQFLATPAIGQTVKQSWMENGATPVGYGTQITGAGGTAAGFDAYTASPSLKYYAPASDSWTGVTGTGISIYNPSGYMVFVRGDRSVTSVSQPANTTTLRTKGALLTGTLSPISVTPDEYASIGNPYASPVDFTLITKGAAIDDQFYVWDPYLYGSYGVGGYQTLSSANEFKPVPGGTSAYPSGTPYYILQSGQAIFVHATSISPYNASDYNLTFSENSKSNSTSANFSRMSGLTPPSGRAFFGVSLYTGNTIADGNTVAFDRSFSDNIDGNDALKLTNGGENFGLKRDGKLLAIEARSPAVVTDTLYYYMTNLQQKTYQLRFAPVNMVASGLQAFLVDNFLNTSTPVSLSDSSFINITVTSNPASSASGRFDVVFRTLSITPVTFTSISAVQKNADIEVDWSVENESGIQQYEVEESGDGNQFTQVATVAPLINGSGNYSWLDLNVTPGYHFYRIRSVGKDGQVQYTQIVKVLIGKLDASFSVYPNPIVNGNIHLAFNNEPAGDYKVRLMNSLGQLIVLKVINYGGGNSMEEITPGQQLAKGIYQLEITKPDGTVEIMKVIN